MWRGLVVFVIVLCSVLLLAQNTTGDLFRLTAPVTTTLFLVHCTFEHGNDGWQGDTWVTNTLFERDDAIAYAGQYSMRVFVPDIAGYLTIGITPENWNLDQHPYVKFAYKIPSGTPVGLFFLIDEGNPENLDWVCLGGTATHNHGSYRANDVYTLVDDNAWHTIVINARDAIKSIDPLLDTVFEFEWWTSGNAQPGSEFWFDEFMIYLE